MRNLIVACMRVPGGNDEASAISKLCCDIAVMPWKQVSGVDNVRCRQWRRHHRARGLAGAPHFGKWLGTGVGHRRGSEVNGM